MHNLALVFNLLTYWCCTASETGHYIQEHSESIPNFLVYWMKTRDDVVFYACASRQTVTHQALLAALPKSRTLWSDREEGFYKLLLENTANNVKTAVFLLAEPHEQAECLGTLRKSPMYAYLTDWIVLPGQNITSTKKDALSLGLTTDGCIKTTSALIPKKQDQICLTLTGASATVRKYGQYDNRKRAPFTSALRGQHIFLACTRTVIDRVSRTDNCAVQLYRGVFRALVALNATLVYKSYGNLGAAARDLIDGRVDIFASLVKEEEKSFRFFSYPHPIKFTRETFYVHKDNKPVKTSIFELIGGSHIGLIFLLATALIVWMTLGIFHISDYGRLHTDALMDSGMFLVATFLANSSPVDTGYSTRGARFSGIGRVITLAAWLLGILPLSAYFRSELTSRLTVTQPPDHVDTTQELESALDRKEIQPCILKDGCFHAVVEGDFLNGPHSLEAKLKEAFEQNKAKSGHVFDYANECLECASKPGFVCLLCGQRECDANVGRKLVESRESLKTTLATTPVRKSFHLAQAYHQLLQRLFETASPPFYKPIVCDAGVLANVRSDYNDLDKRLSQILELLDFFWFYLLLLLSSFVIFCIELTFSTQRRVYVVGSLKRNGE